MPSLAVNSSLAWPDALDSREAGLQPVVDTGVLAPAAPDPCGRETYDALPGQIEGGPLLGGAPLFQRVEESQPASQDEQVRQLRNRIGNAARKLVAAEPRKQNSGAALRRDTVVFLL